MSNSSYTLGPLPSALLSVEEKKQWWESEEWKPSGCIRSSFWPLCHSCIWKRWEKNAVFISYRSVMLLDVPTCLMLLPALWLKSLAQKKIIKAPNHLWLVGIFQWILKFSSMFYCYLTPPTPSPKVQPISSLLLHHRSDVTHVAWFWLTAT